jgi:hypothetical protein
MAFILEALIIDEGDNTIKVGHQFYGTTEREVRTYYREHMHSCEYFRAAVKEGRVIEELEQVDESELPEVEEEDEDEEEEYSA